MNLDATESAIEIWRAGLSAVRGDQVVNDQIQVSGQTLSVAGDSFPLSDVARVCVVGAGKAGAGMTAGFLRAVVPLNLGDRLFGWVNVPSGSISTAESSSDSRITLHEARPAGMNRPTIEAVAGTRQIVKLVEELGPDDLCVCLLSGGGSALLPLPTDDITLDQKVQLTHDLSAAGATIQQLNAVRRRYSKIKAGGLAKRCLAGRLITLIISDVIGDPLDVIASGPTVMQQTTDVSLDSVLEQLERNGARESLTFVRRVAADIGKYERKDLRANFDQCEARNHVIANNQTAVDASVRRAKELGFQCEVIPSEPPTTTADQLGVDLANRLLALAKNTTSPTCIVSGGEPIVRLAPATMCGKGGRNQQLVLSALHSLLRRETSELDFSFLSGGTDGEDGPTDCAGALINRDVVWRCKDLRLDVGDYLARNDAYRFFDQVGGLFTTGPTDTNVCDVRVITISC